MDDKQLKQALGELKRRLPPSPSGDPRRTAHCLTYSRARALALDPDRATAAERAHTTQCHRCRHLLASFSRHLPHLSLWTLTRRQLGTLRPAEVEAVEYHLLDGGCRECAARAEQLAHSPLAPLQLPAPHRLPDPAVARAAVREPEVLVRGQNGDLEADLVQDGDELCLEVRTRNPQHRHRLVGYVFEAETGEALLEGYLVLGPDTEGWYAAPQRLDPERLRADVLRCCQALLVMAVPPGSLSAEEWERVRESAPGPDAGAEVQDAWREFCRKSLEQPEALPAAALETLRSLADVHD